MIQNTGGNVLRNLLNVIFYCKFYKNLTLRMLKMQWKMPNVEFSPYLKDLVRI